MLCFPFSAIDDSEEESLVEDFVTCAYLNLVHMLMWIR